MSKELPEVESVVITGPGSMLTEARIKKGLSIEDVAAKLNFRVSLVKNLEEDIYDKELPDTFNRGYLRNYAKLVNLSSDDVVEAYKKISVVNESHEKMQSFSNGTVKKAQNSILMWISYLILAIFIGLTVMWWLQDNKNVAHVPQESIDVVVIDNTTPLENNTANIKVNSLDQLVENDEIDTAALEENLQEESVLNLETVNNQQNPVEIKEERSSLSQEINVVSSEQSSLTKVIFTFTGDCWVNIHDALGNRIAWGIKKMGYVMTIDAQAPLKITIGKPELVNIDFGGENIDMSTFPEGHIAKLTLPLSTQS